MPQGFHHATVTAKLPYAVTMGDPAGIGPDITLCAWQRRQQLRLPPFFVLGIEAVFRTRAQQLFPSHTPPIAVLDSPAGAADAFPEALPLIETGHYAGANTGFHQETGSDAIAGRPHIRYSPAILAAIEQGVLHVMNGKAAGLVTNPIAKHLLKEAGFSYPGHTEFLAALSATHGALVALPVMLMASPVIKTVPATIHIPLRDVPAALTRQHLKLTIEITAAGLKRYFALTNPRLAICGLNPHAGESGSIGREEIEFIAPLIAELNAKGFNLTGPHPADSLFHDEARGGYDCAIAMYHDQALIPFKTLAFEDGVNVTLGLPFIRTSPDHGTAYSLAGTGKARATSFVAALKLAGQMRIASLTVADAGHDTAFAAGA
jgi:4-hydroxythreonine-4-phosphate dehydrogenase